MKYTARVEDEIFEIQITEKDKGLEMRIEGEVVPFDLAKVENSNLVSILIGNRSFEAEVSRNADGYEVFLKGQKFNCFLEDERTARLKSLVGYEVKTVREKEFVTPMPGLVVTVDIKEGEQIKAGQGLVVVEAMKMENELKARFDAKVKEVKVKPGQAVEKDEVLIVFE